MFYLLAKEQLLCTESSERTPLFLSLYLSYGLNAFSVGACIFIVRKFCFKVSLPQKFSQVVDSLIQKSAGLFMQCSVILHAGERYYQPRVQCKTVLAEMTRCDHKRAAFPNAVLTGTILCAPMDWEVS